jgi:uncharacterized protein YigA (DUF484 family)
MSHSQGEIASREALGEYEVAAYLQAHPDFFNRHRKLLLKLELEHETGGGAVSLVERQVALLRQRSAELERQLRDLVAVAKINDAFVEKIHHLSLRLIATADPGERLELLETGLREDFLAERAVLILFRSAGAFSPTGNGFLKLVDHSDGGLKPFASFLKSGRPRCGLIRERQKAFLFPGHESEIGSAALVPLASDTELGFLAIGSSDRDYFNPAKSMDLLGRLGELVAVALTGRLSATTDIGRKEREL